MRLPTPDAPAVADVEATARAEVVARFAGAVGDGMTVAVGAGSRGLTARVELLRGAIAGLRDLGAAPFVVPAMGSHGGATAEGQLATLAKLGMTADALDCEIRSSMETVVVAHDVPGRPLHLDVHAAGADRDPAGQPDEAAHRVPRPDRERLHEDGRRRLRQAAGRRPVPLERRPS